MRKGSLVFVLTVILMWVSGVNVFSGTKIEWEVIRQLKIEQKPLSAATSFDGQYIYILIEGKLIIYSMAKWEAEHIIPVDKSFDIMALSDMNQVIVLMSSSEKTIRFLGISFIQEFEINGLPYTGNDDAQVTIIVFFDYQCPNCKDMSFLLQQVQDQYKEKVKLVFKNLPSDEFAYKAALASLAANQQNKFWEYHNNLLIDSDKLDQKKINKIASQIGLNLKKFEVDMQSSNITDLVQRNIKEATDANISEVPAVFINGKMLDDHRFDGIKRTIDYELMRQKQIKSSSTK
jgi:glutaredoxin